MLQRSFRPRSGIMCCEARLLLTGWICLAGACSASMDSQGKGPLPGAEQSGGAAPFFDPNEGSAPKDDVEECAASSQVATLVRLDILVMFDRSGSMREDDKWKNATAALKAFIQDPDSAGLSVAIRFFPTDDCNLDCSEDACGTPLIDAAPLTEQSGAGDPQEQALMAAIDQTSPRGDSTPLYPALAGAEHWATSHIASHPLEKAIVILVTDGRPNGCTQEEDAIAGLANHAYTTRGVLTYGMGLVGSEEHLMNEIARKGGTEHGLFIGNGNAQAELLAALKAIQGSPIACELGVPPSENGTPVDASRIKVKYTSGSGSVSSVEQVAGLPACRTESGGFYTTDPYRPTTIALCPSTCQTAQADPTAKIEIVIDCAPSPPRAPRGTDGRAR
jgi:hypothetical protein